jgi:hypothetical protein
MLAPVTRGRGQIGCFNPAHPRRVPAERTSSHFHGNASWEQGCTIYRKARGAVLGLIPQAPREGTSDRLVDR